MEHISPTIEDNGGHTGCLGTFCNQLTDSSRCGNIGARLQAGLQAWIQVDAAAKVTPWASSIT